MSESEQEQHEMERADRSMFVQELLLAAISLPSDRRSDIISDGSTSYTNSIDSPSASESLPASSSSLSNPVPTSPRAVSRETVPERSSETVLMDGLPDGVSVHRAHDQRKDAAAVSSSRLCDEADADSLARLFPNKTVREPLK